MPRPTGGGLSADEVAFLRLCGLSPEEIKAIDIQSTVEVDDSLGNLEPPAGPVGGGYGSGEQMFSDGSTAYPKPLPTNMKGRGGDPFGIASRALQGGGPVAFTSQGVRPARHINTPPPEGPPDAVSGLISSMPPLAVGQSNANSIIPRGDANSIIQPNNDPTGTANIVAGMQHAMQASASGKRGVGGPLPDPQWEGFYQAIGNSKLRGSGGMMSNSPISTGGAMNTPSYQKQTPLISQFPEGMDQRLAQLRNLQFNRG